MSNNTYSSSGSALAATPNYGISSACSGTSQATAYFNRHNRDSVVPITFGQTNGRMRVRPPPITLPNGGILYYNGVY